VAVPVFVNVMLCVALVCPTVVFGKVSVVAGETVKMGAVCTGAEDDAPPQPVIKSTKKASENETVARVLLCMRGPEIGFGDERNL
jgi:hypothetical protein